MNKLKIIFQQLNAREKLLVSISAVLLIIAMFYWLVWSPLNTSIEKGKASITSQESLLAWVKKNSNRAIQLRQSAGKNAVFNGTLTQAVNQSASRIKIKVSRMQPQGDELQVWVDQAPFNDVLSWLQSLESSGIQILDIDIAETDAPGQIKIRRLKLGKS